MHAVPGAAAMVGGNTAITLDIATAADHDRDVIIPIILVLVFLILALLLRAVIAPIMLIATVVLSYAATLGVSALFFNNVFHFGNADNSFPLFVFVFLVALGIDYNIFLMTRVREETGQHDPRHGALAGWRRPAGSSRRRARYWPARSPRWARCPSPSWPSSASPWRSACCSTPSWSGPCWSPRSTWTLADGSGGPAGSTASHTRKPTSSTDGQPPSGELRNQSWSER